MLGEHRCRAGGEDRRLLLSVSSCVRPSHCPPVCPQTGRTAFLCLQTFQRFVSHSLKRSVWTPVEDDLLQEMVDKMRIGNFIPYTQSNDIAVTSE